MKPARLLPLLAVIALGAAASCTKQGFLKAPEAEPEVSDKIGSFSTETHFLLEPSADAEDLLGRTVQLSSKGAWTIADERAPGCQVRVKRSVAEYEKSYRIGLGDMTAMSGGYSEILKLEARYGRSVEAAMKINNVETLTADIEGPCGDVIVNSVRVGTGERRLLRKAEGNATGALGRGPLQVGASREGATDVADEMSWSSPQAYAFTYKRAPKHKPLDLAVTAPESLTDGEQLDLEFTTNQDAYLVIFFLEESGAGAVLYPNSRVPVPQVKKDQPLALPTRDEQKIAAALRDPKVGARETLVVYAFTNLAEFDQFKPSAIGDGSDAVTYAANLTKALASVPISRWARATLTYEIRPKSP